MREILFRGKRKDNGEWVDGDLRHGGYYFGDAEMYISVPFAHTIINHPVVPETVGQYTMMSDDQLKRLFEGDICRAKNLLHKGKEELFTVEWCENSFFLVDDTGTTWHPCYLEDIENIGNIHDNPELLGGA